MSTSKLNRLPKHTFELEIAIPWKTVKKNYDKALKNLSQNITITGFRKGKAPLKLVEKNIEEKEIFEQLIKDLFPEAYQSAIKKHNLKPIIAPKVQALSVNKNNSWLFKATSCEMPEVDLKNFEQEVKGHFAKDKIWTPGKSKEKEKKSDDTKKLDKIFRILIKSCKVEIPDLLIEDEVNRMLSRLVDKTEKLGLTLDQYLASTGKNPDLLKKDYQEKAQETLRLEFVLNAIANKQNFKVKKEEVDALIKATPDKEAQKSLNNPAQRLYLSSILRKRKAIDFLLAL